MTTSALAEGLRSGLRYLLQRRGTALLSVLILAVGIGANAAIFSVVDRVLLQPLPSRAPDRLLMMRESIPGISDMLPLTEYELVRLGEQGKAVPEQTVADRLDFTLLDGDEPQSVAGARVTANFFGVLGVKPLWGRAFQAGDDRPGAEPVAVVSNSFYRRRFGNDPRLAGKTLLLASRASFGPVGSTGAAAGSAAAAGAGGTRYVVIGVLPADFRSPFEDEDIWTPLPVNRAGADRKKHGLFALGRLAPGTSLGTARAELSNILRQIDPSLELHQATGRSMTLEPLPELLVRDVRAGILVLFAAVAVVLLIVCVNVANLQLAVAVERQRELSLRASLGAGRGRLVVQLLGESLVLAAAGGVAGIAVAYGLMRLLLAANPGSIPRLEEISLNPRVLGFSLLVSLVSGLLVGIVPALRGSRANLIDALRPGARAGTGRAHARLRGIMVVVEVALTMVMLVGAGLLIKSVQHLAAIDYGFKPDHLLTLSVSLPTSQYPQPAQQNAFFVQALERVRALPGVRAAGLISGLPMGRVNSATTFSIENRPTLAGHSPKADYRLVSDGYIEAMGIPLIQGRHLVASDLQSEPPPRIVLIDKAAVRRFFPGEDPVGKQLRMPGADTPTTIAGVVGDVVQHKLTTEVQPTLYMPLINSPRMSMAVSTFGEPLQLAAPAAAAVHTLNRRLPVEVASMSRTLANAVARPRFNALLLAILAAIALLLALVGIYGVMSYAVTQRTHEIGVRMALGALPGEVQQDVLRRGLGLAGTGVAIGAVAAVGLTRLLVSQLYGVSAVDIPTFLATALVLLAVGALAAYAPARRATRVDPTVSLRQQ